MGISTDANALCAACARPPATRPQTKSLDPLDLTSDLRTISVAANPGIALNYLAKSVTYEAGLICYP